MRGGFQRNSAKLVGEFALLLWQVESEDAKENAPANFDRQPFLNQRVNS
jgi:hypothetical protein